MFNVYTHQVTFCYINKLLFEWTRPIIKFKKFVNIYRYVRTCTILSH